MPQVNYQVERVELPNENDKDVPSLQLTCDKCGHVTESFGQRGRSLRRCLALMKEECPRGESNYYTTKEQIDD